MSTSLSLNSTQGTSAGSSLLDSDNISLSDTSAIAATNTSTGLLNSSNISLTDVNTVSNVASDLSIAQATNWSRNAVNSSISSSGTKFARTPNNNSITSIPDLADINITSKLSRLSDSTTYFSVVPAGGTPEDVISSKEVEAAIAYRNSFKSGAPLAEYTNFFQTIESQYFGGTSALFYNGGQFSNDSILFWVKKYFALPELSKFTNATSSFYRQTWSSANYSQIHLKFILEKYAADTQSFFGSFSDSIGLMSNSKYHQLDSTQPIFDITQQNYGVPIPFTANMENKVGPTARNLMYNLSKLTTASMRRNLMNLAYYNAAYKQNFKVSSRVPHACNLVNDVAFFVEFAKESEQRMNIVKTKFTSFGGRLWNFVQYISNVGNRCAVNLRDIYAPIDGYDKDFVIIPGSTDIAVDSLDQSSIDRQINEINNFAIADATIARNLYANTAGANGDFNGQNFISKNIGFTDNGWTNSYGTDSRTGELDEARGPYIDSIDRSGLPPVEPDLPEEDIPAGDIKWTQDTLPPGWTLSEEGIPVDPSGTLVPFGPSFEDYPEDTDFGTLPPLNGASTDTTSIGVRGTQENVRRFAVNTDGFADGAKISPTWQGGTATNIPNNSKILGYTIPLGSLGSVPAGTPAILTVTTTDGRVIRELAVGNDTGGLNLGSGVPRQWGELGYNFANALRTNYNVPVNVGYNSFNSNAIVRIDYEFLDTPSETKTFGGYYTNISTKENTYASLRDQLFNEGRLGVTQGSITTTTDTDFSTYDAPEVNSDTATADAVRETTTVTETITLADKVPQPSVNGNEISQSVQNAAVNNAASASSRPYSNRQRMFPFSFLIRGEDIDGESNYIEVDYLLKKIVTDNFNPYTRINVLASGIKASLIQGIGNDGTAGQTLANYARLLSRADLKNLLSSNNADLVLETLGINPSQSGATGQLYNQIKSILNTRSITNSNLSQGYQSFISLVSQRLPTDLMATITNNSAIYDSFAGQLNSISGGVLPTTGDVFDSLNPLNYIDINITDIVPHVSLGSIADFIGIASEIGTSGSPKSISQAYNLAKEINDIVCTFQLPFIDWPIVEELIKMKFNPSEIGKAIKDEFEKIVDRLGDIFDPAKIYEQIKQNIESFYKQIYKDLFTCDEKDKQNKSGQEKDSSLIN